MVFETRPPKRQKPSRIDTDATTKEIVDGSLGTLRIPVQAVRVTHVVPAGFRFYVIKNSSAADVEMNFGSDVSGADFVTLSGEEYFPQIINVAEGAQIHFISGSASIKNIEITRWG